ncbi:MAG: glutamate-5-semialdehyde dehydrogenase [Sedimentisphaerales bacterium]|nr:glutamate-5-semialdehyde dehydrogenase [Sedimentisphaerales bacterium]
MSSKMTITERAAAAESASIRLAATKTEAKNAALTQIAKALEDRSSEIVAANREDLAAAERDNLAAPLLKRLKFDEAKLADVCAGVQSLIKLDEPVGKTLAAIELDEGLELYRVSCPIGVIGVVFESRPDALVQISTLCLKSGNGVLLKGGSEAARTNSILAETIAAAGEAAGLPTGWIQLLETRQDVTEMLALDEHIDLIIPRGSNEFVRYIMSHTNVPVLGHADGICHVYVAADAELEMATRLVVDSKCQYVAVCNAVETLLVDAAIADEFLPMVKGALETNGCRLKGCPRTRAVIDVEQAGEDDWTTEYLDLLLSVKVVDGLDEAIEHINRYGSGHTDAIVTADRDKAETFMNLVDSADVLWNASTRFSDGFRYGLGAEVGISTNKIHARGPVGLEGLVIYKWKLYGKGQTVAEYAGPNARKFTHKKLR